MRAYEGHIKFVVFNTIISGESFAINKSDTYIMIPHYSVAEIFYNAPADLFVMGYPMSIPDYSVQFIPE